jgi:hypothetical protein
MPLNVDRESDILGFVVEGFIPFTVEYTDNDIASLNVVTAQQFYNGEVVIFITNDDKTNTVLVMQNDAAHAHMTAPFGYVLTEA